ncbi:MAG: PepSY domain-containing protein, partial [Bacteroidota bacterium]
KIGDIPSQKPIYEFTTNLHRSLFLKTPGRIFIGITSFLLFLISLTGFMLFIKRQQGIKQIFGKIVKEDFAQFYHLILSRWMLIPIVIISLSGVYLSLLRFSIIPDKKPQLIQENPLIEPEKTIKYSEIPIFQQTTLAEVRKLEFPFSTEIDDFFILSLKEKQLKINQKDGSIVEELAFPLINRISDLSFQLHTGTGSILWSLMLGLASLNILFFLYTGGVIAYKRLKSRSKNIFDPNDAEYIILYGSENGGTREFAKLIFQSLIRADESVYMDELNAYQSYAKMQELIILSSTYGDGDPPSNADKFLDLWKSTPLAQPVQASVVGFGSLAYPNFCQFALDVYDHLAQEELITLHAKAHLIHNKSYQDFYAWAQAWSAQKELLLDIPVESRPTAIESNTFKVLEKTWIADEYSDTFLLRLASNKKFTSGDLLAVYPPNDPVERLYSVAKVNKKDILLSIKRHELGICSNFLFELNSASKLKAQLQKNEDFHFPRQAEQVYLIANGTGIAPFLGMIQGKNAKNKVSLYWGGKTQNSFRLYRNYIEKALATGNLDTYKLVFSREKGPLKYVQDLIQEDIEEIFEGLKTGASIMICGSIAMEKGVLKVLDEHCQKELQLSLEYFHERGQILSDCY